MEHKDSKIDEVVQVLRRRIQEGHYVTGQKLPSERDISEELHVSRPTVRVALQRLQSENVLDILPRAGAIVRSPSMRVTVGSAIAQGQELKQYGSFIRAMEAKGRKTLVKFIEPSAVIPAGTIIGGYMQASPETEVLRRYRLHITEGVPYRILDSYYLASLLGDLLGKDEGYIPLFKWLKDHTGQRAARAFEKLSSRMPTADEAAKLNIARNQPIVDMDRLVWTNEGVLFEYSKIIANAALHEYAYEFDINEEANT